MGAGDIQFPRHVSELPILGEARPEVAIQARAGQSGALRVRQSWKLCVHIGGGANERVGVAQATGGLSQGSFPF